MRRWSAVTRRASDDHQLVLRSPTPPPHRPTHRPTVVYAEHTRHESLGPGQISHFIGRHLCVCLRCGQAIPQSLTCFIIAGPNGCLETTDRPTGRTDGRAGGRPMQYTVRPSSTRLLRSRVPLTGQIPLRLAICLWRISLFVK